jgi:hypothetical protein
MAIEVDNTPGSIYATTKLLADNDINVEYAYSLCLPTEEQGNDYHSRGRSAKSFAGNDASSHANVFKN